MGRMCLVYLAASLCIAASAPTLPTPESTIAELLKVKESLAAAEHLINKISSQVNILASTAAQLSKPEALASVQADAPASEPSNDIPPPQKEDTVKKEENLLGSQNVRASQNAAVMPSPPFNPVLIPQKAERIQEPIPVMPEMRRHLPLRRPQPLGYAPRPLPHPYYYEVDPYYLPVYDYPMKTKSYYYGGGFLEEPEV